VGESATDDNAAGGTPSGGGRAKPRVSGMIRRTGLRRSQRLSYQGELDGGLIADGKRVVPSRDGSSLFQETYPALDSVSALAHLPVETGRTSSGRATAEAVPGLVTAQSARTDARASAPHPGNTDAFHELGEQRGS
jgi:hypothetical protein